MIRIALFASGNGSNAENIIRHFQNHTHIEVACLLSNKADALALQKAENLGIKTFAFNKIDFHGNRIIEILESEKVDWLVLAGFLWLLPAWVIEKFPEKIINIHPALLPKFGGKGMYGQKVHQAVMEASETETGITIHYANTKYDEGQTIFQATTSIESTDTPESIACKVQALEHRYFPSIIEKTILQAK